MGKYNGAIVTSAGQSLIANAVASNQKVIFTTLKASTHVYASTTDFEAMTSIADIVQSVDISYAGVYNNNIVQVSGQFNNTGVATAFSINTIGLYAKVGSGAETLVAVVTAVNADVMPVADPVNPTSIIYNIQMTVQNSGVMEVEVNDAGTINVHQFNDALYSTAAITVPTTGWTASGSQYTKTIDVGGITSSSMPFVELQYPDNVTATQKKAIDKAASKLVSLTTTNYGQVVLTATEVPATSFNLLLRGLGSGQYTQPYNEFFTTVLDKEPYVSRTARDGLVKLSLIGATVAWNQLISINASTTTDNGITFTPNNGAISAVGTSTGTSSIGFAANVNVVKDHIYFMRGCPAGGMYNTYRLFLDDSTGAFPPGNRLEDRGSGSIKKSLITTTINGSYFRVYVYSDAGAVSLVFKPQLFDLTQMFGTTIADYVNSLERTTEGSGIAWLKSYGFFTKDYYEYDAGSLQSVCTSARKITALDGTVRTYPIDNEELRGLFKLDANNKLYADGDIYPSSGSGTRKYAIVDLGSLEWTYYTAATNPMFYADIESGKIVEYLNRIACLGSCSKYNVYPLTVSATIMSDQLSDKLLAQNARNASCRILVRDSTYTDAASFKTAMSGVYLVYELNEPTTFSADPYINPQRSEGTEEFVDGLTRDVMIPVGNESTYFMSDVIPIMSEYIDAVTSS